MQEERRRQEGLRIDVYHHGGEAMHWPWDSDPVLGAKVDKLNTLVEQLIKKVGNTMSALSDKIAAVGSSLDAALARVDEDVQALVAKIAELQALVDAGGATPDDIAALDALQAKLDALDPTKPAVLPE